MKNDIIIFIDDVVFPMGGGSETMREKFVKS